MYVLSNLILLLLTVSATHLSFPVSTFSIRRQHTDLLKRWTPSLSSVSLFLRSSGLRRKSQDDMARMVKSSLATSRLITMRDGGVVMLARQSMRRTGRSRSMLEPSKCLVEQISRPFGERVKTYFEICWHEGSFILAIHAQKNSGKTIIAAI